MLTFTIQDVNIEFIKKGTKGYSKATVTYTHNGANRTQNIMSFSNPGVFAQVKELKQGDVVQVELTKNDAGYNEWAKLIVGEPEQAATSAPKSGRVTGSNYETPEERARKQVYIVRQSSLTAALAFTANNPERTVGDVTEVAQQFVDFVLQPDDGWPEEDVPF